MLGPSILAQHYERFSFRIQIILVMPRGKDANSVHRCFGERTLAFCQIIVVGVASLEERH